MALGFVGVGIEAGAFAMANGLDGNDVPDVFGDDVGDEEIDFGGGVDGAAGPGGFDAVAGFEIASGGFDLNAEEAVAEGDDGVVALAVSPREADAEAEVGGAGQESGFGGLSATLAGGFGDGVEFDQVRNSFGGGRLFPAGALEFCDYGSRIVFILPHNEKGAAGGCA